MITSKLRTAAVALAMITVASACNKGEEPVGMNAPNIEFISADLLQEGGTKRLSLKFSFEDIDGDIGLDQDDDQGVYAPGEIGFYNLYADYFEKINGAFTQLTPNYPFPVGDTIRFNGRIPILTPEGKYKAISGEIEYLLDISAAPISGDAAKLEFYILDRALNKSNIVETTEFNF